MFPNELRLLKNWVGFKLPSKIPMNPLTGEVAASDNKTTWGTYTEAIVAAKKFGWDGVGFMFEPPYVGIDLDDCVINGKLNEFARSIIIKCKSYAEFSPSKTGIHIIGRGSLSSALKTDKIEAYQTGRYFTVTNQPIYPIFPLKNIALEFLEEYRDKKNGTINLVEKLKNIKDGTRNNDLFSIASSLRSRNYKPEEIYALLKPKAIEISFDDKELQQICQSVGRYEPKAPESQASSVEAFLEQMEEVEWLCEPIVARQTLGFIAGLPETGKTWMLIDLAIECARGGGKWLKRFPVKAARVLFIDQERFKGETQRRFKAVITGKEMQPKDLKGNLFIRCGTTTRIDLQNSFEAFRKEVGEIKPDLIIIDSFVTFHSSDENNRQSIQLVLERIKQIRNEFGCTFLFIDHENKGAFNDKEIEQQPSAMRMSGSVAKPAAAELVLTVRKQDAESSFVYHTKSTLASTIPPFLVKVVDMDAEKTKISVEAY